MHHFKSCLRFCLVENKSVSMNNIKMLVLDIDGTIFKKDYTATPRVQKTLKNLVQDGIKVVLCTGRMYAATKSIALELGLNTPVICYQGGLIKDFSNGDKTLWEQSMDESLAKDVIKELKQRNIFFNLYINDILMVEHDDRLVREYVDDRNIEYKVVGDCENLDLKGINKILAIDDNTELIADLQKEMAEKYKNKLYVIRSTPRFCEFSDPNATKGNALRFLAGLWGIKKEEIMACGDQDNDIEMLLAAGIKVAMGNATEDLKKVADYVTESVDNDGVAVAVARFIGEKYEL